MDRQLTCPLLTPQVLISIIRSAIVRETLFNTGYDDEAKHGLDYQNMNVVCAISEISHEMATAISMYYSPKEEQRASMVVPIGECGSGVGYATDEMIT